jgi:hypothetical protein
VFGVVVAAIFVEPNPGVPRGLLWTALGAIGLAGLAVTAQSYRSRRYASVFGILTTAALIATLAWVGFAPGEQSCTASFSIFGIGRSGRSSCWPFAVVAVLFGVIFVLSVLRWLRRRSKGDDSTL